MVAVSTVEADAQGFLDRLGKRVAKKAEEAVTRKAEQAVDKAVDKATDPETYKGDGTDPQQQQGQTGQGTNAPATAPADAGQQAPVPQTPQSAQMAWNKFDFVSGDEIMFEDVLVGEQLGEFPSMWDMIKGNVEIANMDGENMIAFYNTSGINPLMKNPKDYLPEIFTIEFDVYLFTDQQLQQQFNQRGSGIYNFYIRDGNKDVVKVEFWNVERQDRILTNVVSTGGEKRTIDETPDIRQGWHKISISFNQRALKIYFDETRIVNAPNVAQGRWFAIETESSGTAFFVKNVRIAKGAVPLYDRMMSDGKFITYGITFDVGKSTIKPESMGEINRIVQLMNENPTLRFSVEGHTDSTGNAASNQTLSEARSAAIVAKLTELGIAADRLTSSGKGQGSPIADNATDEGRAKNRRVEFVKIN